MNLARVRKAAIAVCGALATILATNSLPERYQLIGVSILTIATAFGVYQTPNDTNPNPLPGE